MLWYYQIFADGHSNTSLVLENLLFHQHLWEAVPNRILAKSTTKSSYYIVRHPLVTYLHGILILSCQVSTHLARTIIMTPLLRTVCWSAYWGFQGFAFAGI